jgi:hypothetical protein
LVKNTWERFFGYAPLTGDRDRVVEIVFFRVAGPGMVSKKPVTARNIE